MSDALPGQGSVRPDPDHPGWYGWHYPEPGRFDDALGKLIARREADGFGCLRMLDPAKAQSNMVDALHGGAIMGFVDIALFAIAAMNGVDLDGGGQTIDCNVQFIAPGALGVPLDARGEVLRETGRLVFLRGLVLQGDTRVAAFSGTIRKPSRRA